jgi:hypothetical protein
MEVAASFLSAFQNPQTGKRLVRVESSIQETATTASGATAIMLQPCLQQTQHMTTNRPRHSASAASKENRHADQE